ncbi:unnamed protein product, partial [Meganyctiphanes norvegica]
RLKMAPGSRCHGDQLYKKKKLIFYNTESYHVYNKFVDVPVQYFQCNIFLMPLFIPPTSGNIMIASTSWQPLGRARRAEAGPGSRCHGDQLYKKKKLIFYNTESYHVYNKFVDVPVQYFQCNIFLMPLFIPPTSGNIMIASTSWQPLGRACCAEAGLGRFLNHSSPD